MTDGPTSNRQCSRTLPAITGRTCILVLGMHRSGTSAITRLLAFLGLKLPRHLAPANARNETGYWEPERLVALHDEMLAEAGSRWDDWRPFDPGVLGADRLAWYEAEIARLITEEYGDAPQFVIKDPRICRFVGLYEDVLSALGVAQQYVLNFRNPFAVMSSLAAHDGMTGSFAALLWLRHVLDAEAATRGKPRALVSYERLISGWQSEVTDLRACLEVVWPVATQDAAKDVDAFLHREPTSHAPLVGDHAASSGVTAWVTEAYQALVALKCGHERTASEADLDRIGAAFSAAVRIFGDAVYPELRAREERFAAFQLTISKIYASTSWRVTTPLRMAKKIWTNFAAIPYSDDSQDEE
jgi:O-antigen biosynthesis protein